MNIPKNEIQQYLRKHFKGSVSAIKITTLGSGVLGTGYRLDFRHAGKNKTLILKSLFTQNLGKDHFSDRAGSLLLANDTYNQMKSHVRSVDVVALDKQKKLISVGDSREFFILMEEARGDDLFKDLNEIKASGFLDDDFKDKLQILAGYLVGLHRKRHGSPALYRRKFRDTIGGPESIMSLFDMYPDDVYAQYERQVHRIASKSLRFWRDARKHEHRLCEVHGDFHPGNLWFDGKRLTILDRARGRWGEPADDITAFLINPILFSLIKYGRLDHEFKDMFRLFWNSYFRETEDREMRRYMAPFFAFRCSVICNPIFYNDDFYGGAKDAGRVRKMMFDFAERCLGSQTFNPEDLNRYILG